jgi:hypothetical protein
MQDLFPDLGINYTLNLIGTVVSENANEAIIRWAADVNPNQCVNVNISGTRKYRCSSLVWRARCRRG